VTRLKDKYGPWALVTGATAGLGAEFTRQLAADGLNLVITAPPEERPEDFAMELRRTYGVEVRPVPVDLSQLDFIVHLQEATQDLEIGLLVSNSGAWLQGPFPENDLRSELSIVQLNMQAPAILAREYGRPMAERGRGGIVFVGSTLPNEGLPVGAGPSTRSYNLALAEALWYELAPRGVDVMALSPEGGGLSDPLPSAVLVGQVLARLGEGNSPIPGRMSTLMNLMGRWMFSQNPNERLQAALSGKAARANLN
jgi:short-subunit dehydrogenase